MVNSALSQVLGYEPGYVHYISADFGANFSSAGCYSHGRLSTYLNPNVQPQDRSSRLKRDFHSILSDRRKLPYFTAWISNTNSPPLQVAEATIHSFICCFFNNKSHLSLTAKSESDTSYANCQVRCQ